MEKYHAAGSLATRDIVARAIDNELKKQGDDYALLDITHLPAGKIKKRFPNIYQQCLKNNVDITKTSIWVTPAAHYMCGGVCTDIHGRTTIKHLYACGEVAHTGLHGANRLASNSLLEALVFAHRAFQHGAAAIRKTRVSFPEISSWNDRGTRSSKEWVLISHNQREIQNIMWDYVGIVRYRQRLLRAQKRLELISQEIKEFYRQTKVSRQLLELRNLAKVARLIVQCALLRRESRGLHYITDYPRKNNRTWLKDTIIQRPPDED
jgi:L-aspartate oxidase